MVNHSQITGVYSDMVLITKYPIESSAENTTDRYMAEVDTIKLSMDMYIKAFKSVSLWQLYIVLSILYISGIIANTILLIYLVYYKRYKSPVFCVILSLCVSDLIVCVAGLMWLSVFPFMMVPPWMCNVAQILLHGSILSSSYLMIVFAVLRFYQLVYPLSSRVKVTVSLLRRVCLAIWMVNSIQALVLTPFFEPVETEYMKESILICWFTGDRNIFMICESATWLVIPFLSTSGFHFSKHIILLYKKPASENIAPSSGTDQKKWKQTDSQALAIVISVYLITILPALAQYLRYSLFAIQLNATEVTVTFVFEEIAFTNSSINPWIYMFAAGSVRSDIRKLFGYRKH